MTSISTGAAAKLQIGTSTAASLPAPASDTFTDIPQLKTLKVPEPAQQAKREVTLDSVTLQSTSPVLWSDCTGTFVTNYTQAPHNSMLSDRAVANGQFRNWRAIEPDAGNRQTDFVGACIECDGGEYIASEDGGQARIHTFRIVVRGAGTITA